MQTENVTENVPEGRENDGLGEVVIPEDPNDPTVVGEISNRRVLAVGGVLFAICAGFVFYGFVGGDEPERRPVPTASVTYRVTGTGTADVSYVAEGAAGGDGVEARVDLPWRKTVRVPLGTDPALSIRLGERGGEASCALSVRGEHRQRATAFGAHGRATCTTELPAKG
ncbi:MULTISPECIES: hypothetical protein [unclassified Streptomyces]|uniref:hypothetical protein n=1 Tax=unclassified Streptomyces TaxID=2593676 RepID=UPI0022866FF4|nr:hypothetical protein [Streptomyces sp. Je 1-369]WAL97458.1 hypothetical protein NOO62_24965 [Streptomyces sp. Je 1-369]